MHEMIYSEVADRELHHASEIASILKWRACPQAQNVVSFKWFCKKLRAYNSEIYFFIFLIIPRHCNFLIVV